jgi:TLC domain
MIEMDLGKPGIISLLTGLLLTALFVLGWTALMYTLELIVKRSIPIGLQEIKKEDEKRDKKIYMTKYYYYISCLCAYFHAPITALGSAYLVFAKRGIVNHGPSHNSDNFYMIWTCSFFIFDIIFGRIRNYLDVKMQVHHVVISLMVCYCFYSNKESGIMIFCFFLGEITNPLLNFLDIIEAHKLNEGLKIKFGLSFLVSFIFIRSIIVPYYSF